MRKRCAALLLLCALAGGAAAGGSDWPEGLPKQPSDPVTDLAGMLSPGATQHLNDELRRQWQEGHFQLAVLTLPSLKGLPIEDLSIQVARAWALGSTDASNGVLLLIATEDHKMRIEVGSRLEGALPDIICHRIIEDSMAPRLRQGDADGAVVAGVAGITASLAPNDALAAEADASVGAGAGQAGAGTAAAGLGLAALLIFVFGHPLILLLLFFLLQLLLRHFMGGGRGGFYGGGFGGGGFGGGGFGGGGFSGGGGGFSGGGSSGGW